MKKRILSILLAGLMICANGCGTDSGEKKTADTQSVSKETELVTEATTDVKTESEAEAEVETGTEATAPIEPQTIDSRYGGAVIGGRVLMDMKMDDIDLSEVRLGDVISENKVTMINFWGTFCGPCINEMPGLGELERKYKDQGFEILGLTGDIIAPDGSYNNELIEEAHDIADDTGITYPLLIASYDVMYYANIMVFPTTYFIDSEGNMLSDPYIGSRSEEEWETIITTLLDSQK